MVVPPKLPCTSRGTVAEGGQNSAYRLTATLLRRVRGADSGQSRWDPFLAPDLRPRQRFC